MNTTTRNVDYTKLVKDLIYERFKTPYEEKINKNGIINSLSRVKINGVLLVDILNDGYKFSKNKLPLKELVYLALHNEFGERPKCTQCNLKSAKFRNITEGYRKTCGIDCIKKYSKHLISNLNIKENIDKTEIFDESEKEILNNILDNNIKTIPNKSQTKLSNYERTLIKYGTPFDINNIKRSVTEIKFFEILFEMLSKFGIRVVHKNPREIFKDFDMDLDILLITEDGTYLAIEVNGPAYHCTSNKKNKYYHKNKTEECKKHNIRLIHISTSDIVDKPKYSHEFFKEEKNKKINIILKIISSILDITGIVHKYNVNNDLYPKQVEYSFIPSLYKEHNPDISVKLEDELYIDKININNNSYKKKFSFWKRDFTKYYSKYGFGSDIYDACNNFMANSFKMMIEDPEYIFLSLYLDGYKTSGGRNCFFNPFSTAQFNIDENKNAIIERYYNIENVNVTDESSLSLITKKMKSIPIIDEVYYLLNCDFESLDDHIFHDSIGSLIDYNSIEYLDPRESIYNKNNKTEYLYDIIKHSDKEDDFSYIIYNIEKDKNGFDRNKTKVVVHNRDMINGTTDYLAMFNSGYIKFRINR